MKAKVRLNKIITILLATFIALTLISIVFIIANYYGVFDRKPTVSIKPDNTYAETLHVATDYDYKPFSYIDNGEYAGLDVELITEVVNRLGMNLDLTLLDWSDAQRGLENGTYDVILNMESNAILRDDNLIGTIPTDEKQYVVYGKNRVSYVGELYGTRVAAYNKFDELGMSVITGYSYQEMFNMLLKDELDYVICPIQIGDNFISALHAQTVLVSSYQVSYMYGCIALRADETELCAKLNQVIKELQIEGFIEKLDKKWVTRRYTSISLQEFLRNNPLIIFLFVVLIQLVAFGSLIMLLISKHSQNQQHLAAELQKNLDIINQQNDELRIANEKAQAASVAKSKFLFNMSHDIRTPMNAIIGFTNLASRHLGEEEVLKDYLSKISASSDLLLGLINDVLEMARIENGKTQLNLAPENIEEILGQIDAILHGQASDKRQELLFQISISHKYVLCDKLKIHQVLINIISNAIKYTPQDGHILVRLVEEASPKEGFGTYVITVKDDGLGMSEEFQAKIFEPFEREKATTISKIPGTGLGMSIIKSLLDLMGGKVALQSRLGEGSEFTVTLELAFAKEPPVKEEEEMQKEKQKEAPSLEKSSLKILVVDDNEINRMIATEILSGMGYQTEEACDGEEAVEKIQSAKPGDYHLILMDIQMPVLNGYEAAKQIRRLPSPLAHLPIIALTANAYDDDIRNSQEAGMNGHVAKPIDVEVLGKTIQELLFKGKSSEGN